MLVFFCFSVDEMKHVNGILTDHSNITSVSHCYRQETNTLLTKILIVGLCHTNGLQTKKRNELKLQMLI